MNNYNVISLVKNDVRNDNRVVNQATSLKKNNHDVTILAYQRETNLEYEEIILGVNIIRIKNRYEYFNKIKYVRGIIFEIIILFKSIEIFFKNSFDVVHCHDLNTLQIGLIFKLLSGGKIILIYDAHEYETQKNLLSGFSKIKAKIKERILIKYCDRVITVSDTIAKEYSRLYGIPKPTVILNCPVIDPSKEPVKSSIFRKKFNIPESNKIFLYQGYLVVGRGIELVLNAFNKLGKVNVSLVFMGEGSLLERIKRDDNYNKSIFIHPFVTSKEIIKHTASADFGISFIEDISLSDRYCLPNKLFEYIAAGLPVITSGLPEMKNFIETYKVGVSADENSVCGFLAAFRELLSMDSDDLDRNIKKARKLYNWGTQEKILVDLYQNLAHQK